MKTASRNMEREAKKRFEIMTGQRRDVTLQKLSVDWTREILYSLRMCVCGTCFAEPDTFSVSEGCFGVFRGGIAMPKTICVPDTSSLKPGSGATEGVLD